MCELGTGVLNWSRQERISDRYGAICLLTSADPTIDEAISFIGRTSDEGKCGKLVAVVKEARKSYHVGDLDRGVYPETPEVGKRIILGEGTLFFRDGDTVGLRPNDGRLKLWLDIRALYNAHHQTVTLYFEPS